MTRAPKGRKLLVASIGVATLSYVAASCAGTTGPSDGGTDASGRDVVDDRPVANLVAPPIDVREDFPVANLVAPPIDARD